MILLLMRFGFLNTSFEVHQCWIRRLSTLALTDLLASESRSTIIQSAVLGVQGSFEFIFVCESNQVCGGGLWVQAEDGDGTIATVVDEVVGEGGGAGGGDGERGECWFDEFTTGRRRRSSVVLIQHFGLFFCLVFAFVFWKKREERELDLY